MDESQVVSRSLGFERVNEALIVDPARMTVAWRGPARVDARVV